jgi:hypothetical protein
LVGCDGYVRKEGHISRGQWGNGIKWQNYTLIGAAVLRRWCFTIKKNGDNGRILLKFYGNTNGFHLSQSLGRTATDKGTLEV